MDLHPRAKELRKSMTNAEAKLWLALRDPAMGFKFRRQVPLGHYIGDFVCLEKSLIIEVDGGQHAGNAHDAQRDAWLESQGFRMLRFWNHDVLGNIDGVLAVIQQQLRNSY